jgi:hypothetical protein
MIMSNSNLLTDCRFCSEFSKANREDPIGSAPTYDRFLLIETRPPWPSKIWVKPDPLPEKLIDALNPVDEAGVKLRPIAIAPDREYSQPGYTHVFYYYRPARIFAHYEKRAFLVPNDELANLGAALLQQPDQLADFERYQQGTSHIREVFVCTHGNHDEACGRFGYPIYRHLHQVYAEDISQSLRVWRCSHFGGHQFAPTLLTFPEGHCWGHLELSLLDPLIKRAGSVETLCPFYRGWVGLSKFEQIVEREIWMREGWAWFTYAKAGQILAIDTTQPPKQADWAKVRIDFTIPGQELSRVYEARVEACDQVETARWSAIRGESLEPEMMKQYRVSHLARVA